MAEKRQQQTIADSEAGQRYHHVVEVGKRFLKNTAITDESRQITANDIEALIAFHREISPSNPQSLWRQSTVAQSETGARVVDSSTYTNWEAPGGPLEHINLASQAAMIVTRILQEHLRPISDDEPAWLYHAADGIKKTHPLHAAAATLLHDEGREVTHLYYTTELIGRRLLQQLGVRQDLRDVLPDEQLMLTPPDESFDEAVRQLAAEQVIIRIADEFGKRFPKTNRIYEPADYTAWDRNTWAAGYINRPLSGRPSDAWMRTKMQLHVDNVPRYFQALDNWIQACTDLTLAEVCAQLSKELDPELAPLV